MAAFSLTCSPLDQVTILNEINALRQTAQSLYMLGYFENHLRHLVTATARLANVP
jgi:hypothetical protein